MSKTKQTQKTDKNVFRVSKTNTAIVIAVAVVVAGIATLYGKNEPQSLYAAPTCYQQLAEAETVATIATATGVVPGKAKRDPIGTKYTVKNNCK